MDLDKTFKGAIIAGLLSAGSIEAPERERSAHELAYAANRSQELTIDEAGFDRLDDIAENGTLDLEDVVEPVDVRSDGTGTYRVDRPIAHIGRASLDDVTENHEPIKASFDETTTFYKGTGEALYNATVAGVGSSPSDAIAQLIANATEGTYGRDRTEVTNRLEETNGVPTRDEVKFSHNVDTVSYAGGVDLGTFTVEAISSDGMLLGYLAKSPNATVYGQQD